MTVKMIAPDGRQVKVADSDVVVYQHQGFKIGWNNDKKEKQRIEKKAKPPIEYKVVSHNAPKYCDEIRAFRDKHFGERCFIIGSGTSLNALSQSNWDFLDNEITIGINRVDKQHACTYTCVMDEMLWRTEGDRIRGLNKSGAVFGHANIVSDADKVIRLADLGLRGWSNDLPSGIYSGKTTAVFAMQVAQYMGFKEIYLLGVDLKHDEAGNTHAWGKEEKNITHDRGFFRQMQPCFEIAARNLKALNVETINLNPDSAVECFEKRDIADVPEKKPKPVRRIHDILLLYQMSGGCDCHSHALAYECGIRACNCGLEVVGNHAITASDIFTKAEVLQNRIKAVIKDKTMAVVMHGMAAEKNGTLDVIMAHRKINKRFKTAVVLLDDPYEIELSIPRAKKFDLVLTNERNAIELHGHGKTVFMPVVANPVYHTSELIPKRLKGTPDAEPFDIYFCGGGFLNTPEMRQEPIKRLAEAYPEARIGIAGVMWTAIAKKYDNITLINEKLSNRENAEYVKLAKVVLNLDRHKNYAFGRAMNGNMNDIEPTHCNPRTFEVAACGGNLIAPAREDMAKYFPDVQTFSDTDELVDKVGRMLMDGLESKPEAYYTKDMLRNWLILTSPCGAPADEGTSIMNDKDKHLKVARYKTSEVEKILPDFKELKLKEKTVIIVGAGPSLDKNIALLKRIKKKTHYIACVNGSMNALNRAGVKVDFCFTADKAPQIQACFDCCDTSKVIGVFRRHVPVNVLNSFDGKHYASESIADNASVTGYVLKTFKDLGFDKFVLVGCDFEISGKKKTHCRYYPLGQIGEITKFQIPARAFEKLTKSTEIINCTEGGILTAPKMTLQEYINNEG